MCYYRKKIISTTHCDLLYVLAIVSNQPLLNTLAHAGTVTVVNCCALVDMNITKQQYMYSRPIGSFDSRTQASVLVSCRAATAPLSQ